MPQTFSQKYDGDPFGFSYVYFEDDGWNHEWNWTADNEPAYSVPYNVPLRHSQVPSTAIETANMDRSIEIPMPKGKGKGKPKGKGHNPKDNSSHYTASVGSSMGRYSSSESVYSSSQGSRLNASAADPWNGKGENAREGAVPPFKVSSTSDVRIVAGAIANAARRGARGLSISACGAASINQAVKSIAVARGAYLENDDVEIDVCGIKLADEREFKHLVNMELRFVQSRERPMIRQKTTHKVSGSSTASKVAGAIASSLRDGVCCQVAVVGADAMLKAVLAISICASYIETDHYPFSLLFWPDFDTIYVDGEKRTGVSLYIIPSSWRR
jgi:stage V sporulation protein SpoVS